MRFLKEIFGITKGPIEIRCLPSKARIFSQDFDEIAAFVAAHYSENIYFGACTRKGRDGSKKGVFEIPALWVDIDFKHFPGGRAEAEAIIAQFPLKPSIIVFTGGGFHLYWLLQKPRRAGRYIEQYLRGLADRLNGDRAAAEIARVLRLPGTNNYKYTPPIRAHVVTRSGRRYKLRHFGLWKAALSREPSAIVRFSGESVPIDLTKFSLKPHIVDLITTGYRGEDYASRSEADMAVVTALVRIGATEDEIRAIFQTYAIGEKYREHGVGDRYLARTIARAKTYVESNKLLKIRNRQPVRDVRGESRNRNETEVRMKGKKTKTLNSPTLKKKQRATEKLQNDSTVRKVIDEFRPLLEPGPRIMTCVDFQSIDTFYGSSDILTWEDEQTGKKLQQFFRMKKDEDGYSANSKAVRTYCIALDIHPGDIREIDFHKLVGVRAEVDVETVEPLYRSGSRKGQPKPKKFQYSKVNEILSPDRRST